MNWTTWLLGVIFSGVGVTVLAYFLGRLGRVRFESSDWHLGFWESSMPGFLLIGDESRAPPSRAGSMECTFSVEITNSKSVDVTLHRIAAMFYLPNGST